MSTIITLKNGKREYIFRESDFVDIVDRELGSDAREYLEECFNNQDVAVEEAVGDVKYETRRAFGKITDKLMQYLMVRPLSSETILNLVDEIREWEKEL